MDDAPEDERAVTAIEHTPEVEAYLGALDHLDAAKALVDQFNGQVSDQIHAVKCEVERACGFALFREARAKDNGSQPPEGAR